MNITEPNNSVIVIEKQRRRRPGQMSSEGGREG